LSATDNRVKVSFSREDATVKVWTVKSIRKLKSGQKTTDVKSHAVVFLSAIIKIRLGLTWVYI